MSLRSAPPLEGLRNYSFDQSVMLLSRIGAMSGRVKMSKFLLTVCAFGLLLSFAFAEEKSPEQHREESNQMLGVEGVQKMELTRVVASGTNQRIYFFYAVHPDCSASDINIRVTKQPEHGTVETAAATDFPNFGRENIRHRCNQHKVRGQQVKLQVGRKIRRQRYIRATRSLPWRLHSGSSSRHRRTLNRPTSFCPRPL